MQNLWNPLTSSNNSNFRKSKIVACICVWYLFIDICKHLWTSIHILNQYVNASEHKTQIVPCSQFVVYIYICTQIYICKNIWTSISIFKMYQILGQHKYFHFQCFWFMYTYFDIYENLRTSIGTLKHLLKFNKQAFSFLCVYMYMYSEKKQIKHQEIKNTLNAKCVLIYIYIKD